MNFPLLPGPHLPTPVNRNSEAARNDFQYWRIAETYPELYPELRSIVLIEQSVGAVLRQIADLAARSIPGADEASVTMIHDNRLHSVEFSGRLGIALDERQFPPGFGPCLEVAHTGRTTDLNDTGLSPRYPKFACQARRHGVHHVLSLRLGSHQVTAGVLTIYGFGTTAFDLATRDIARDFADQAAAITLNCMTHALALEETHQLRQALASRAGIEQAKGIVMRDLCCSPDEAFSFLRDTASRTGRKVRDIAQDVVRTTIHPEI